SVSDGNATIPLTNVIPLGGCQGLFRRADVPSAHSLVPLSIYHKHLPINLVYRIEGPISVHFHDQKIFKELFLFVVRIGIHCARLLGVANRLDGIPFSFTGKGVNIGGSRWCWHEIGMPGSPVEVINRQLLSHLAYGERDVSLPHFNFDRSP